MTGDPNASMPEYYKSLKQQKEEWSLGALLSSINDSRISKKDGDDTIDSRMQKSKATRVNARAQSTGKGRSIAGHGGSSKAKSGALGASSQQNNMHQDSMHEIKALYMK